MFSFTHTFFVIQVSVGGIIMLKDSKSDEPEDLIEPLPGKQSDFSLKLISRRPFHFDFKGQARGWCDEFCKTNLPTAEVNSYLHSAFDVRTSCKFVKHCDNVG